MDIKIIKEEKSIILLFSLPNSHDNLVLAIGINSNTLNIEYVVSYIMSEEIIWKNMEVWTKYALMVRGRSIDGGKVKFSDRQSQLKGINESLIQ